MEITAGTVKSYWAVDSLAEWSGKVNSREDIVRSLRSIASELYAESSRWFHGYYGDKPGNAEMGKAFCEESDKIEILADKIEEITGR
jgi:hypothetical protein